MLNNFMNFDNAPSFTMDYKLPSSGMEAMMELENFKYLGIRDTIKFVSGSMEDLQKAKQIIEDYALVDKTKVYISPVFGGIELDKIVDFMVENKLIGVNLQVQLHKIIWDPNKRGV